MKPALADAWRVAVRTLLLLAVATLVAGGMLAINGVPSPSRRVTQNEIARFAPSIPRGLVQLLGETALVVGAAWFARRVLKVRL